jgi:hypothetical protein
MLLQSLHILKERLIFPPVHAACLVIEVHQQSVLHAELEKQVFIRLQDRRGLRKPLFFKTTLRHAWFSPLDWVARDADVSLLNLWEHNFGDYVLGATSLTKLLSSTDRLVCFAKRRADESLWMILKVILHFEVVCIYTLRTRKVGPVQHRANQSHWCDPGAPVFGGALTVCIRAEVVDWQKVLEMAHGGPPLAVRDHVDFAIFVPAAWDTLRKPINFI